MRALVVAAVLVTGGLAAGCDEEATVHTARPSLTTQSKPGDKRWVRLTAHNDSGQEGTAVLTEGSSGTAVDFWVSPPKRFPGKVQRASIGEVACAETSEVPAVVAARSKVTLLRGRAETTVPQSLAELETGFSILVYEPKPPYLVVLCGEITSL